MTEITREAVKVRIGLPKDGVGDWPVTCTPLNGGTERYCYMQREMAELLEFGEDAFCWAEWNGISYDFIDFMSDEEVGEVLAMNEDVPF